jgi:hypothetical protein
MHFSYRRGFAADEESHEIHMSETPLTHLLLRTILVGLLETNLHKFLTFWLYVVFSLSLKCLGEFIFVLKLSLSPCMLTVFFLSVWGMY